MDHTCTSFTADQQHRGSVHSFRHNLSFSLWEGIFSCLQGHVRSHKTEHRHCGKLLGDAKFRAPCDHRAPRTELGLLSFYHHVLALEG